MLKLRLMTALVLLTLVILANIFLPLTWFVPVVGVILLYGAWEWSAAIGMQRIACRAGYVVILALASLIAWYVPTLWFVLGGGALWVLLGIWVYVFPRGKSLWTNSRVIPALLGLFVLFFCWTALVALRAGEEGMHLIFLVLIIVWSADSGAFFVGRRYGKHKLAPELSPNKTKEGFYAGFIVALLFASIYAYIFDLSLFISPMFAPLIIITTLFSVIGDLFESMVKRLAGIKDSGQLLPGHGGLLDRIDSLLAAAPIFALAAWLLG